MAQRLSKQANQPCRKLPKHTYSELVQDLSRYPSQNSLVVHARVVLLEIQKLRDVSRPGQNVLDDGIIGVKIGRWGLGEVPNTNRLSDCSAATNLWKRPKYPPPPCLGGDQTNGSVGQPEGRPARVDVVPELAKHRPRPVPADARLEEDHRRQDVLFGATRRGSELLEGWRFNSTHAIPGQTRPPPSRLAPEGWWRGRSNGARQA